MRISITPIAGVMLVEGAPQDDSRGSFVRVFCADTFRAHGMPERFVQTSLARNAKRGTLRGLHFQRAPFEEGRLVRCTRGALFDVVVDLRPGSVTYRRWHAETLSADNGRALYIPEGLAHGYQTLADDTDALYFMTTAYAPDHAAGLRWNDPTIAVAWPLPDPILSDRDRMLPVIEE
jgi:dTDP-4-dehydrorhamnose 3,5-epimerase